jgi:hypothetical protein
MAKKIYHPIALIISLILFSCTDEGDILNPQNDRDAFLGIWNVTDSCFRNSYDVNIVVDSSNSTRVIIQNFWLIGYNEKPPYAIIAGSTITIPNQTMCYNKNDTVSGSGQLYKGKIKWDYTVNDGADLWTCTSTYNRP